MSQMDLTAPTCSDMHQIATRTVAAFPAPFAALAQAVVIQVADFADPDMAGDDPFALTGLYDGVPLTEKSSFDQPHAPDIVWLFRRPILDEWADRGNVTLTELVAHVTVHEFAHHFGWSDDDIAAIDAWWT